MATPGTPSPKKYQSKLSLHRERTGIDSPKKKLLTEFVKIADLTVGLQNAKIKGRVISRTQQIHTAHGVMFSAVIMDSTSCIRIVGWGTTLCDLYYNKLKVGKVVTLDSVGIKIAAQRSYSWVDHLSQITLNKLSLVDESEDSADMPRHNLTFTKLEKCVDSGKVVDVIGVVYEIGEVITIKTAKQSCKREITILDQWNKMATITMWNETAEKFIIDISSLDNAIVAFGGVKVSAFARDSGEIFLDSFDDSINPDIPDERELREWLKDNQ
ncbi:replication factor A protein 1-like isoform X2 [Daphnia pulex]|uniref:replication factor A protein 1-like isoform X2 n=1 Tax=Daphnia pulex TaxID=6669 RepID=UPI001EDD58BB|nr:replication factor A protein 1-like isoform X2 [Daphnia pulex]